MGLSRTWCQSGEFVLECEKRSAFADILVPLVPLDFM